MHDPQTMTDQYGQKWIIYLPQTTKEREHWATVLTPITITYKPKWYEFWKKPYSYEISREEGQRYLNRRMKELMKGIKWKNQ